MTDPAIRMAGPVLGEEERRRILEVLDQGWISSMGGMVPQFERGFADFIGADFGVAVCNGTIALSLALLALGLQPGQEVIVPTITFGATANAVALAGGIPRFVSSDPIYWQIDIPDIARSIRANTAGIIAVHLYGHPANMGPILEIAEAEDVWVLEDAAEAHGAAYRGERVGTLGAVSTFSFYANKIITTGEGGMCLTNDAQLADRLTSSRNHGLAKSRRYWHERIGSNFRMTNLQAALGVAQLERIDQFIAAKRRIARLYAKLVSELGDRGIVVQQEAEWAESVWWMYNVILPTGTSRELVMEKMSAMGVETRPFFHPLHTMPAFKDFPHSAECALVEDFASRGLTLPSGADLSDEDVSRTVDVFSKALAQAQESG